MPLVSEIALAISIYGVGSGLVYAQTEKNDLEHEGLIGKVKTVQLENAKIVKKDGKQSEEDRVTVSKHSYDRQGRLIQSVVYARGRALGEIDYQYEKDGSRQGSQRNSQVLGLLLSDLSLSTSTSCSFSYDSRGNRTAQACRAAGGSRAATEYRYEYDERDQRIGDSFTLKERLEYRRAYSYDDKRNVVSMSQYDANGKLANREYYSYEFDSTGNWIRRNVSKLRGSEGHLSYERVQVSYRTISYY